MKNRQKFWAFLLLFLLVVLMIFLTKKENPTPAASAVSLEKMPVTMAKSRLAVPEAVETPQLPPVKIGGAPLEKSQVANFNDFGDVVFSEERPVVRTLASGDTAVMFANNLPSGAIHFEAIVVRSNGKLLPSKAELEALTAKEAHELINRIDQGTSVNLLGSPGVTTNAGDIVEVAVGLPSESGSFTIRLKPIVVPALSNQKASEPAVFSAPTQPLPAKSFQRAPAKVP